MGFDGETQKKRDFASRLHQNKVGKNMTDGECTADLSGLFQQQQQQQRQQHTSGPVTQGLVVSSIYQVHRSHPIRHASHL
ncbi:hypothetical protein DPMN_161426 [Dreissena polymorpha]|uniref:Uncharacterized protein n=1 Tax=Dreissena polymorpha TaxID=45954 RepID=A0A9D4EPP9_DREPO|nr:hypothetical protein DPMN_161426 [Dreissena polymorpha]